MNFLPQSYLEKGISYQTYRTLAQTLWEQHTTTNGDNRPEILDYTRLNLQRMNRLDKTIKLLEKSESILSQIPEKWYWIVLTESWCGDAAQIVPVIHKMAEAAENISLKILLRDENLELIDAFLTNGGRAIPKLICVRASDNKILGSWGARPAEAQKLVMDFKANPRGRDFATFAEQLHGWYAKDKTQSTQNEIYEAISKWIAASN